MISVNKVLIVNNLIQQLSKEDIVVRPKQIFLNERAWLENKKKTTYFSIAQPLISCYIYVPMINIKFYIYFSPLSRPIKNYLRNKSHLFGNKKNGREPNLVTNKITENLWHQQQIW